MTARRVTIAGGGLAGLSLGIALRRQDIPVRIIEATNYPRHRVCGEFVSGIREAELDALGIKAAFASASSQLTTIWYDGERLLFQHSLPEPARGISRHLLDATLASQFLALGGDLLCGERCTHDEEGTVWASGRVKQNGGWIGMKAHFDGLPITADLEIHLANHGYVGLTQIENKRVNVSGLFKRSATLSPSAADASALIVAIREAGLPKLARRLQSSTLIKDSLKGVTHFSLGWQMSSDDRLRIGDAAAMIPPITGNGMTMAFQSALSALTPLATWSRGEADWRTTRSQVRTNQHQLFSSRLRWAWALQSVLLHPWGRRLVPLLLNSGVIRFDTLYRKLR